MAASRHWRDDFVRTFLERDLPVLGNTAPSTTLRWFWTMLAHWHGQLWNGAEFGRAFGVAHTTVRRYLDLLTSVFVVRQLQPWHENVAKRQVRSPKVYIADSGFSTRCWDWARAKRWSRIPRSARPGKGSSSGRSRICCPRAPIGASTGRHTREPSSTSSSWPRQALWFRGQADGGPATDGVDAFRPGHARPSASRRRARGGTPVPTCAARPGPACRAARRRAAPAAGMICAAVRPGVGGGHRLEGRVPVFPPPRPSASP